MTIEQMVDEITRRFTMFIMRAGNGYELEIQSKHGDHIGMYYGSTFEIALRNCIALLLG